MRRRRRDDYKDQSLWRNRLYELADGKTSAAKRAKRLHQARNQPFRTFTTTPKQIPLTFGYVPRKRTKPEIKRKTAIKLEPGTSWNMSEHH